MDQPEFDAAEVIAGFPLVSIKRALGWVGIMDDRDDIESVAEALGCPPQQAERVLAALERRGLVTKAPKKRQWDTTALGKRLGFYWHPPRRIHPAIQREPERGVINEIFDAVPCSILRADPDDGDAFEEADVEVGVFVEYESDRLIEISVTQPDDYDHREANSMIDTTVYLGVADAKGFAKALQIAIERAEAEVARRATAKPRKKKRAAEGAKAKSSRAVSVDARKLDNGPSTAKSQRDSSSASSPAERPLPALPSPSATAAAMTKAREDARKKREKEALAATLKELRGAARG